MPIVLGKDKVVALYRAAAERRWVVPTFCAENQTTIEAVLAACQAKATELGVRVPVTIAITASPTNQSPESSQASRPRKIPVPTPTITARQNTLPHQTTAGTVSISSD